MTETRFLERFVGTYDLMGMNLIVALKGRHALQVSLPGQPDHELEPIQGTEFRLKGLSGFSIEFRPDDSGPIGEALITQPDGLYAARKTS